MSRTPNKGGDGGAQPIPPFDDFEARLRMVLDAADIGLWEYDFASGQVNRNLRHDQIFGYGELQEGWSLAVARSHVLPDDVLAFNNAFRQAVDGGVLNLDCRIRRPDGAVRWVHAIGRTFYDPGGEPLRMTGVLIDETDRQQSSAALREREREFSTLADNIPQLAWIADAEGSIVWYNRRWYDYTGTTLDEVAGWGWKSVHHPDHVERVTRSIGAAFESGEPWEDLFPLRSRGGEYRWFLSRALPIRDEEGRVVRWFGTNTDVTERFELEEALRVSEDRFQRLADAMPQLVWTAWPDGSVDYYNRRVEEYEGFTFEDGRWSWQMVLHPDDLPPTMQAWEQALRTGSIYEVEHRVKMKDGSFRWHLSRGLPVWDEAGEVARWYGTATDVHDLKEAQQALEAARDRFAVALEAAEMGTWESNFTTKTSHRSLRHDQIFGYDELQAEWGLEIARRHVVEEDLPTFDRAAQEGDRSGKLRHEVRIRRPDGEVRWIYSLGRYYYDDDGQPVRRAGVIMDVTERKEAEQALRRLNETLEEQVAARTAELRAARDHFATLFDASPVAAAIVNVQTGTLVESNPELGAFFGTDTASLTGLNVFELGLGFDRRSNARLFRRIRQRERIRNEEMTMVVPERGRCTALVSIEPIDLDGAPCVLVMLVDITPRKRAEDDIRRLSSSLALAEQRERRRLSQVLHDDLQQILFGAEMRAAAAHQRVEDHRELPAADVVAMRELLASAIQTTRALAIELNPPVLRGDGLAPALQWLARHMHQMHGLSVEVEIDPDLMLPGEDERVLIVQMARELLFNVVKHAGVGRARLSAAGSKKGLTICVEDAGVGFDYDALVASSRHRDSLGLYSVGERLRLIGGQLRVDARPGEGTTIWLDVPVRIGDDGH